MLNKKRKGLLVSVALLLMSASLLTTASFAWFAMNTKISADNFNIEAHTDSMYLQIKKASEAETAYGTTTDYSGDAKSLQLVTYETVTSVDNVFKAPVFTEITADTYYSSASTVYYERKDSDVGGLLSPKAYNYDKVDTTDFVVASNLSAYYTNVEFEPVFGYANGTDVYFEASGNGFNKKSLSADDNLYGYYAMYQYTLVTGGTYADNNDYYEKGANNVFTKVTVTVGETVTGNKYTRAIVTTGVPVAASGTFSTADVANGNVYWTKDESGNFSSAADLTLGTNVKGFYTRDSSSKTTETYFVADTVYYVENTNNDFVCLGKPGADVFINGYTYWGRAYSTVLNNAQGANTLNVLPSDDTSNANYYYKEVLNIRQGENTNHASNLKVSKVTVGGTTNSMTPAIRVLIVATSPSGEAAYATYNNRTKEIMHNGSTGGQLFETLLGDEAEEITVNVYIYFDGTDETAKNTNLGVLNGQSVSIEFSIDELDYNKVN